MTLQVCFAVDRTQRNTVCVNLIIIMAEYFGQPNEFTHLMPVDVPEIPEGILALNFGFPVSK